MIVDLRWLRRSPRHGQVNRSYVPLSRIGTPPVGYVRVLPMIVDRHYRRYCKCMGALYARDIGGMLWGARMKKRMGRKVPALQPHEV